MGHYLEPDLELNHHVNTRKSSATVFQLEYNPFTKQWSHTHADFVPAKASDTGKFPKKYFHEQIHIKKKCFSPAQQIHIKNLPPTNYFVEETLKKLREVTIAPPDDSHSSLFPSTGNFGGMFAVDPKPDCPHLADHFNLNSTLQQEVKSKKNKFWNFLRIF
jgi:hypothetical protein